MLVDVSGPEAIRISHAQRLTLLQSRLLLIAHRVSSAMFAIGIGMAATRNLKQTLVRIFREIIDSTYCNFDEKSKSPSFVQ